MALFKKEDSTLAFAEQVLEDLFAQKDGIGIEIYCQRSRDRGIELREGRLESISESEESGFGLRLFDGERTAFAFSGGIDRASAKALYASARARLRFVPPDPARALPEPAQAPERPELVASMLDETLFSKPLAERLPELLELHSRSAALDPRVKKILQIGYGESASEAAVASSTGIRTEERGTSAAIGLSVMAEMDGEVQIGSASRSSRKNGALDFDAAAQDAVFRSSSLLGARKLPSGRRSVVFDPWVAGELVDLVAGLLSAEAVQRGRSLLKGKMGKRIASSAASFIDDPLLAGGPAGGRWDDEGVPTKKKDMIADGILKEYFYDSHTARKEGLSSNGSAGRGGFKSLPAPSASNFFLKPGALSREALIRSTKDGVLVFEMMGMHTADPISGEMSVGLSGVAIKDGEISHGVRGAMLSTNLLDLLSGIDAVADDLVFYGSSAAPTFRVAEVQVAA